MGDSGPADTVLLFITDQMLQSEWGMIAPHEKASFLNIQKWTMAAAKTAQP